MNLRSRRPRDAWDELVDLWLDSLRSLPDGAPDDLRFMEEASQQRALVKALLEKAVEQAKGRDLQPQDAETEKLLSHAWDVGTRIAYAWPGLTSEMPKEEARAATSMLWGARPGSILFDVKRLGEAPVARDQLEHGVGAYLRGDLREVSVDRLLVLALMDMEVSAYLASQINKDAFEKRSKLEIAQVSRDAGPSWRFWLHRLKSLLMALAFSTALFLLMVFVPSTPPWVFQGGVLLAFGLWLLSTIVGMFLRAFYPRMPRESAMKVIELVKAAGAIHGEFSGTAPISVPHLRRSLEELRDKDFVWPGALWALLDDVERRGVHVL